MAMAAGGAGEAGGVGGAGGVVGAVAVAAAEALPCGKEWDQCGGKTVGGPFAGASCCRRGLECKAGTNAYYSRRASLP